MKSPSAARPLVSIGIPTYNRARELERAISSSLFQDYANVELVVSDNASSDGTESLCAAFASRDSRVRYLRQPTNRGVHANFRTVLAESRGEFFMWLGDDDWLDPGYVSQCVAALTADSACSIAAGFDRYYVDGKVDRDGPRLNLDEESGGERVLSYFSNVAMNGVFYGVMRKDLISRIPIVDLLGGDWLVVAAMAYLGRVRTLDSVCINRSFAGVSRDLSALASTFGLTGFRKEYPMLTIAATVLADIGWRSPVYAPLGPAGRILLATRASLSIVRRHYSPGHAIQIARQLLARLATDFQQAPAKKG